MTFDTRTIDLRKLNSLTKYPSIPTYHALGERGALLEDRVAFDGRVLGTEKVDGTNGRIVFLPDGFWIIGSREELLLARGDLIGNPALGIADALRAKAEELAPSFREADRIRVLYAEVFGGTTTAQARQYTGRRAVSFRLFDMATIAGFEDVLARTPEQIAAWRDAGGQPFVSAAELARVSAEHGLEAVPPIFEIDAAELPRSVDEAHAFLREQIPRTRCKLDEGAGGEPEGIVIRTPDRRVIAKLRFEDYERAARRRAR
jgi:hypothetical protein